MKKNNSVKKILGKILVHVIELVVLYVLVIWIQKVAPSEYALPAIVLFAFVYLIYLGSSIVDDYLDVHGADFII